LIHFYDYQGTKIKPLWGTAQLFMHPRYMHGAATRYSQFLIPPSKYCRLFYLNHASNNLSCLILQLWSRSIRLCCSTSQKSHGGGWCRLDVNMILVSVMFLCYYFFSNRLHTILEERTLFSGVAEKDTKLYWTLTCKENLITSY